MRKAGARVTIVPEHRIEPDGMIVLCEMNMRFTAVDQRLDRIESRLDRQAGLIQAGSRALLRIDRWADASDRRVADLSSQVQSLETRVSRLEHR